MDVKFDSKVFYRGNVPSCADTETHMKSHARTNNHVQDASTLDTPTPVCSRMHLHTRSDHLFRRDRLE